MALKFLTSVLSGLVLCGLFFLCGCRSDKDDKYEEKPVQTLYQSATKNLEEGSFKKAAKDFEEVLRQHPYSSYATRAQLMAAYAHYRAGDYTDAIASTEAFLQLHPANPGAPYAYYLRALCYYNQISSADRDQKMTEDALQSFQDLIQRFPLSKYAKDAKLKLDLTREHIAGGYMAVGRFYLSQNQAIAALNRFRSVVTQFETTSHTPEALYRMVEAYMQLGVLKEAQASAAVLGHNYPGSTWYKKAFALLENNSALPTGKEPLKLVKGWDTSSDALSPKTL